MDFSIAFILYFSHNLLLIGPLVILLLTVILGLGIVVGRIESWSRFDAFYWALITATTVGYGDIKPTKKASKSLSIAIVFSGLILSGITVAMAIEAGTKAFSEFGAVSEMQLIKD